ncbi:alpha-L-glutamate ligase [Nesterenkonia sp. MY13]|uniref:Alpha-L-glutamate ligase n=1 Tax=Nesterenkonia sedimenti TaxID=1463632 RepID=A0A7X8YER3_9MICC|nr:alpha-L-glutamate ligase [Nesterenkonia sedimenti]NLS10765.1 alpha-L-glutamate ligase [Nesterenkonia sedimenti]
MTITPATATTAFPQAATPVVYVIHDNPEWIPPFADSLAAEGVEYVEWLLTEKSLDLTTTPPQGVFWSRLSASSHTRTDPHVKEYGRAVLAWLEAAGRTVVNGSSVYELEVSKVRQHGELAARGFDAPKTSAVFGSQGLAEAAEAFTPPFITKHNQGGKGLGVRRFDSHQELAAAAHEFAPGGPNEPIDGITLLQEYLQPAEPFITRAEFIGGTLHYAVKVDISGGSFELCPAEACEIPGTAAEAPPQFQRREEITEETPLIQKLTQLLEELNIPIVGVEFIETTDGRQVVYDINTNTNYNPDVETAEQQAGRVPATRHIAQYLAELLKAD